MTAEPVVLIGGPLHGEQVTAWSRSRRETRLPAAWVVAVHGQQLKQPVPTAFARYRLVPLIRRRGARVALYRETPPGRLAPPTRTRASGAGPVSPGAGRTA